MKCTITCFAYAAASLAVPRFCPAAQAPPSKPPLSLTVTAARASIESGQEVVLDVVLTNVSNRPLFFSMWPFPDQAMRDYKIEVVGPQGEPAPKTAFLLHPGFYAGSHPGASVPPGAHVSDEIPLTRFFDLTAPGRYQVRIARRFPRSDEAELTLTVHPDAPPMAVLPPRRPSRPVSPLGSPFRISLAAEHPRITSGQALRLIVQIQNPTSAPEPIDSWGWRSGPDGPEAFYDLIVRDPHGRPAPPSAFAQWAKHTAFVGELLPATTLAPGAAITDSFLLTKFFDLTLPGTYSIQLAPKYLSYPQLKSNVVQVSVVP